MKQLEYCFSFSAMDRLFKHPVYGKMMKQHPWMLSRRASGREHFCMRVVPVRANRPCGNCVGDGTPKIVYGATRLCGGCKIPSYCDATCQEKDWPRHKAFCKEARAKPSLKKTAEAMWKSGLFTSSCGMYVHCVPCVPDTKDIDTSIAVSLVGSFPAESSDCFMPSIVAFILASTILAETKLMGMPVMPPTCIDWFSAIVRESNHIYHVPMWRDVKAVYDCLRGLGIELVEDTSAGTGLFVAMMSRWMRVKASDVSRHEPLIYDAIKIMDAREAIEKSESSNTAMVMSWPDTIPPTDPPFSSVVIEACVAKGIRVLVVMADEAGIAMVTESHAILKKHYRMVLEVGTHTVGLDGFLCMAMMYGVDGVEADIAKKPSLGRLSQTTSVWTRLE